MNPELVRPSEVRTSGWCEGDGGILIGEDGDSAAADVVPEGELIANGHESGDEVNESKRPRIMK